MVENYAPLSALRPQASGCELAWHARDDLAPGLTMWALWCRHVFRRLLDRVRRSAPVAAQPRVVRQPGEPNPLTDDEKASSC